jgi:hypothetical protein
MLGDSAEDHGSPVRETRTVRLESDDRRRPVKITSETAASCG